MKVKRFEDENQRGRTCVVALGFERNLPTDTTWRPVLGDEFDIDDLGQDKHRAIWESLKIHGCHIRSITGEVEIPMRKNS